MNIALIFVDTADDEIVGIEILSEEEWQSPDANFIAARRMDEKREPFSINRNYFEPNLNEAGNYRVYATSDTNWAESIDVGNKFLGDTHTGWDYQEISWEES